MSAQELADTVALLKSNPKSPLSLMIMDALEVDDIDAMEAKCAELNGAPQPLHLTHRPGAPPSLSRAGWDGMGWDGMGWDGIAPSLSRAKPRRVARPASARRAILA